MDEKETGRLEAFSDGVFAVAITLLVLNIKIPGLETPNTIPLDKELRDALFGEWPMLVAYITSFATIGVMWLNHHRLFVHIKRIDTPLMLLNLLLLLIIVFIPVPTALLAEYLARPDQHVAAILFTGTYLLMAICFNVLWRYASYNNRLLGFNVERRSVEAITRQYLFGPLLYLFIFIVAWFNTPASIILSLILVFFFTIPSRPLRTMSDAIQETRAEPLNPS